MLNQPEGYLEPIVDLLEPIPELEVPDQAEPPERQVEAEVPVG